METSKIKTGRCPIILPLKRQTLTNPFVRGLGLNIVTDVGHIFFNVKFNIWFIFFEYMNLLNYSLADDTFKYYRIIYIS